MPEEDDILSLLLSAQPDAQARALAQAAQQRQAAQRQNQIGMLGMLTGDRVLSGLGQQMIGQAQRQGEGLQQTMGLGQQLRQKLAEAQAQREQFGQRQAGEAAQLEAQIANQKAQRAIDWARLAEEKRYNTGRLTGDKEKSAQKIPAGEAIKIGGYDAADKGLEELSQIYDAKTGPMSGLAQFIPGTESTQYKDAALATAQSVGSILEKGKLTDADLPKYLRMLPTAGDSKERKNEKIANVRRLIKNAREAEIRGAAAAGYDVGTLGEGAGAAAPPPARAAHPQAAAALEWAKKNPGDPRAKKIMELVGGGS